MYKQLSALFSFAALSISCSLQNNAAVKSENTSATEDLLSECDKQLLSYFKNNLPEPNNVGVEPAIIVTTAPSSMQLSSPDMPNVGDVANMPAQIDAQSIYSAPQAVDGASNNTVNSNVINNNCKLADSDESLASCLFQQIKADAAFKDSATALLSAFNNSASTCKVSENAEEVFQTIMAKFIDANGEATMTNGLQKEKIRR